MNASRIFSLCALAAAVPAAFAQSAPGPWDPQESLTTGSTRHEVEQELEAWRERFGANWRMVFESETGHARFLHGGSAPALFTPRDDAGWFTLARAALQSSEGLHGIQQGTLVEDSVTFLPLGNAGSSDKMTVQFRQQVAGVPVVYGFANVLFDMQGRLLSVDTTGLPDLAGFSTSPAVDGGDAVAVALQRFTAETGLPPTEVTPPALVIDQAKPDKLRVPRLAWQVEVAFYGEGMNPEGYRYTVDALNGAVLDRRTTIHNDVSGTVRSMASPGLLPDTAANPEQNLVMPHLRVTSAQGNATTDSNGNFNIVGATAPLQVTVRYEGSFANTSNQAGADYQLVTTLNSSSGNSVDMNPTSVANTTAEANSFLWIGLMRDWTRAVNPADATCDFTATSNVNISNSCNAFFNGNSVNFYLPGGSCPNTAFSTVVLHEMGHWLNVLYASGNGPDGFGEGNADNFATFISDNPIVGQNFCGNGCHVRTGLNNRQFCGDNNGGCHGGVHADGEVLMGAFWKWRTNLKSSQGAAAGAAIANTLFNSWMNAYNDSQIKTIVETHILTLDDNDGNINNGTPHYGDIDAGFRAQGFPGFDLSFVTFSNVTVLGTTQNEVGPYVVNADVTALFNPPVQTPTLRYRVDGGAFQDVPMALVSGSTYTAGIPGQISPAKVEYYLTADDALGNAGVFPDGAPTNLLKFIVGIETIYVSETFEGGVGGWTHASPNGSQDDWHHSSQYGVTVSFGKAGDPTAPASSGVNIWGNDLGPSGFNGFYSNNVSNFLRSPTFDLSQATGSTLRFQRWLNVEGSVFDRATVKVNGQQVWINPTSDLLDSSWQELEIDISAIADGNPSVQIEFGLVTDQGVTFGGWNIDDLEIVTIEGVCGQVTTYCTAKTTSQGGTPFIGSLNNPSQSAGNWALTLTNAVPNQTAVAIRSTGQAATPFQGGTLCVQVPVVRSPAFTTDQFGFATYPVILSAPMVGQTFHYQWWFRDVGAASGTGLSNALSATICQ